MDPFDAVLAAFATSDLDDFSTVLDPAVVWLAPDRNPDRGEVAGPDRAAGSGRPHPGLRRRG